MASPCLYSLGARTQVFDFFGGSSFSSAPLWSPDAAAAAAKVLASTTSRKTSPVVASPQTFAASIFPPASKISFHSSAPEQDARKTPVFLALIAMWLKMSTGCFRSESH